MQIGTSSLREDVQAVREEQEELRRQSCTADEELGKASAERTVLQPKVSEAVGPGCTLQGFDLGLL